MWQSDLALEKYWVTQSGYFRLATSLALGMGIAYGKLLYCHSVAGGNMDRKISTLEYNNMTFYYCFNNTFIDEFGSPDLNIPPITFDDRPHLHKRSRYNPDLLPYAISVASNNSFINLTTPPDLPYVLPSDDHNTPHVIKKMCLSLVG